MRDAKGSMSRYWFFEPLFSGRAHETVDDQALVESLRTDIPDSLLHQYLPSVLTNVERLIDRKLGYLNQGEPEKILKDHIDQKIEFQYMWAVFTTATARGESLPPVCSASHGGSCRQGAVCSTPSQRKERNCHPIHAPVELVDHHKVAASGARIFGVVDMQARRESRNERLLRVCRPVCRWLCRSASGRSPHHRKWRFDATLS